MTGHPSDLPAVNSILTGPHWPGRVRVVRAEPMGANRILIEAVTLNDQSGLISRYSRTEELVGLQIDFDQTRVTLDGDPLGFKLAAEATCIPGLHV